MVLGMFLFMNFMERQQVRELSRRKPVPARPAGMPQGPVTPPTPEVISDMGRLRDAAIKECVGKLSAPAAATAAGGLGDLAAWVELPLRLLARSLACEALAEKKPAKCAALKGMGKGLKFDPGGAPEDDCDHIFNNLRGVYEAVQGSPAAIESCIAHFKTNSPFKVNKLDAVCRLWVEAHKTGNEKTVCKEMSAYVRDQVPLEGFMPQCKAMADSIPDPKVCYDIPDPFTRSLCLDRSAVYAAAKAKDPALCGSGELCRGLMLGSVEACAPLKAAANEAYCAGKAVDDVREMVEAEMKFRFENSLPAYRPGDNLLTRMSPEEKKRAVEDLQRTSQR
ncbi:MAG TPA: hypothetical protein DD417_17505 [Elusimicrobia bacterium]|nr:hypothetical protein [Elusimicrobiota bacterium]